MNSLHSATASFPIGNITLFLSEHGELMRLRLQSELPETPVSDPPSMRIFQLLTRYFAGENVSFHEIPLKLEGTQFQCLVWNELMKIPYGALTTYGAIARKLGIPSGARAIGNAVHKNPIPIIIPCHRVIASNGAITGYAYGLPMKEWLLGIEKRHI